MYTCAFNRKIPPCNYLYEYLTMLNKIFFQLLRFHSLSLSYSVSETAPFTIIGKRSTGNQVTIICTVTGGFVSTPITLNVMTQDGTAVGKELTAVYIHSQDSLHSCIFLKYSLDISTHTYTYIYKYNKYIYLLVAMPASSCISYIVAS